jgi:hypothetical protein
MLPVAVGPTLNRSVVGILVDFAKAVPVYLDPNGWDDMTLLQVEARLAETPCYASQSSDKVIFPDRDATRLLLARWGAG